MEITNPTVMQPTKRFNKVLVFDHIKRELNEEINRPVTKDNPIPGYVNASLFIKDYLSKMLRDGEDRAYFLDLYSDVYERLIKNEVYRDVTPYNDAKVCV